MVRRTPGPRARLAVAAALLPLIGSLAQPAQAQARPFLSTADGAISARIDGTRCGELVKMIFVGKDAQIFQSGLPDASRLMNNVTTLLRQQCPALARVSSKGMVGDRIYYSGIAEAATDWTIVELGSGTGYGLLSGTAGAASGTGGPSPREAFSRDPQLVAPPKMLDWLKTTPYLCVKYEAPKNSCAGINVFEARGAGAVQINANYRLDESGSTAVLVYPAQDKGGLFCSSPNDAKISIKDGNLTPAGRAEMQSLLLERVQGAGPEICTGYRGEPRSLTMESFGADGNTQAQKAAATLLASRPVLRLDR